MHLKSYNVSVFQSTLPLQGETYFQRTLTQFFKFQSTLPLLGETLIKIRCFQLAIFQSTLPLQGETNIIWTRYIAFTFQSTLPLQGETKRSRSHGCESWYFNPLSLCWERRWKNVNYLDTRHYFNPLSLCRERRSIRAWMNMLPKFQSTLPLQGETMKILHGYREGIISIHSPSAGRDDNHILSVRQRTNFNPLSLCRERPYLKFHIVYRHLISIHSPSAGRDGAVIR